MHSSTNPGTDNTNAPASQSLSSHQQLALLRQELRACYQLQETEVVRSLLSSLRVKDAELDLIQQEACTLVKLLRAHNKPTMMESFLSEYGLSTREGVGLMCLAEALLRVPDATTIDELIADKLESSDWAAHLGQSSSPLVNASTWALLLTGRLLDDSEHPTRSLAQLLKRVGEPVVRTAVAQAMKLLGRQFVLGQNIDKAIVEARTLEKQGYTYSYDMLGEAAHTHQDAQRYTDAYATAIDRLSSVPGTTIRDKPGISVKLSALHPRYEYSQKKSVIEELVPTVKALAEKAARAGIGFNIDAEEADRLDLSLDVIEALLQDPMLANWDGLGVVVQAYSRRAVPVINWLIQATALYDRKIMVRLVKGAYWDSEIKQAQELGLASFPVFTRKINTDVSYLSCAQLLLAHRDRIYPQFATHNAYSVSAIRHMAGNNVDDYEFQRLHGMGESLHERIHLQYQTRCRIYAPVGAHKDLLAYLVRRLLENGANSSFVNQIVDHRIAPETVASCPVRALRNSHEIVHPKIAHPLDLYLPQRKNSKGFRINDPASVQALQDDRETCRTKQWHACSILHERPSKPGTSALTAPANRSETVGFISNASPEDVNYALDVARQFTLQWSSTPASQKADYLRKAADAYENATGELCAMLCREAGKTLNDAISEVREAVDFLRYYAAMGEDDYQQQENGSKPPGHGVIVCISPWNFPLAIFTGQIAGALMGGNTVLAKPAEQTPLIAAKAVELLHANGVPRFALQLLPGTGATVGQQLTSDIRVDGVCFTGSTKTSRDIERSLASRTNLHIKNGANPNPLLMAETGGLNAMIVDSSALTEQVVRDAVMSAFQSAGQRCSALRILYVQKEAEQRLLTMLMGAMDTLQLGDPWQLSTDIGPVIDEAAFRSITNHLQHHQRTGTLIHQTLNPTANSVMHGEPNLWILPSLIRVNSITDMQQEIFGPVLHIATFEAKDLSKVVDEINASGYGLTFGLHTRIDDRVQQVVDTIHAGNVYVNRNQIGAVVGSQPFGGEGLSGTGPKAGGPWYVPRLMNRSPKPETLPGNAEPHSASLVLPGPTGESNLWRTVPRTPVLLIDDGSAGVSHASDVIAQSGCRLITLDATLASTDLLLSVQEHGAGAVVAPSADALAILCYRKQLAQGDGPLIPLLNTVADQSRLLSERHVCIDTTAAGGNASLLGSAD
jgi:RHH-type transcriptional regulator, proline utilization regulon repressor / proline dehydrogenase / delta 1-pyrroline-5-carboxylate dehydrogenase